MAGQIGKVHQFRVGGLACKAFEVEPQQKRQVAGSGVRCQSNDDGDGGGGGGGGWHE